jgi:hypothetical protein
MNFFCKRLPVAGIILTTITLVVLGSGSGIAQVGLGDGTAPELEGTWRTTVSIYGVPGGDPPPLEGVLHSFTRGGVVMIGVPLAGQTVAQGVWTRVGPRRFGFTVEMSWFDLKTGQLAGRTKVKEIIEVNQKGDEYRSVESSAVDYYADGRRSLLCTDAWQAHGRGAAGPLPLIGAVQLRNQ